MPERHGQAFWPGVEQVISCTYTCSLGTAPGTAVLVTLPQEGLPDPIGDLVITDNFGTITLKDCKADKIRDRDDESGISWTLEILDRRWKWRDFGLINGAYNQRDYKGNLLSWTIKTASELAELLLKALGETNYDIQLPEAYPAVNWDVALPGNELTTLAAQFGCVVAFDVGQDMIRILPQGEGADLPDGSIASISPAIDSPEQPSKIVCYGDAIRFEAEFDLEPVGEDVDGSIQLINDLSYQPSTGWDTTTPPLFGNLSDTSTFAKEQAKKSVWRWYRLKLPITLPYVGSITRLEQILLEDRRIGQQVGVDGYYKDVPAEVWAVTGHGSATFSNTGLVRVKASFSIDAERQIVKFDDYVFKWNSEGAGTPADPTTYYITACDTIYLVAACQCRDADTNQVLRYFQEFSFPDAVVETPPEIIRHDEIKWNIVGVYDGPNGELSGFTSDLTEANAFAAYYLAGAAAQYEVQRILEATYNGIVEIFLDGAIQQVTWTIGESGAETTASRNTEHSVWVPPIPERQRIQFMRPREMQQIVYGQKVPVNVGGQFWRIK